MTLHLRESTIHEQFDSRDVAAIVGGEKHNGFSGLIGRSEPTERNAVGDHLVRFSPTSEEASNSRDAGVSIDPGLTAFTRMRRSFKSVVHVRANERTAALVAE